MDPSDELTMSSNGDSEIFVLRFHRIHEPAE
jgi:hypothetical protein